jgi:hypothetical protein
MNFTLPIFLVLLISIDTLAVDNVIKLRAPKQPIIDCDLNMITASCTLCRLVNVDASALYLAFLSPQNGSDSHGDTIVDVEHKSKLIFIYNSTRFV